MTIHRLITKDAQTIQYLQRRQIELAILGAEATTPEGQAAVLAAGYELQREIDKLQKSVAA